MKHVRAESYTPTEGKQELKIVYPNGLIRSLLKLPEREEQWVGSGTVWYAKGSGKRAGTSKEYEICEIMECHRQKFF